MLQAAQHDDNVFLLHRKGHSNLQEPISRTDHIGLGLRWGAGSGVSQSCSFAHDGQRHLLKFQRRQAYTGSACTSNEMQRNGIGSSKLIWLPRLVISQSLLLEGVSTPTSCQPYGASINVNERTYSPVRPVLLRWPVRCHLAGLLDCWPCSPLGCVSPRSPRSLRRGGYSYYYHPGGYLGEILLLT